MEPIEQAAADVHQAVEEMQSTLVELESSFEPIELTASADRFSRVVDVMQTIALVVIALALRRR